MAEVLQFPFVRGMDEGADPKGLPPGQPIALENCYPDKAGRLVKRSGTAPYTTGVLGGGTISSGSRLITRGSDVAVFDGEKLYTYSDTLAKWIAVDRPSPLIARKRPLIDCGRTVRSCDIAISGNLLVTFYSADVSGSSDDYLYVEVRRLDTGELVMAPAYVATGLFPRVVMTENDATAYLFWMQASTNAIWTAPITMATLTIGTYNNLITDAFGTTFDAIVPNVSGSARIYVAYGLNAGAARMQITSFNPATYGTVNAVTHAAAGECSPIAMTTDGTYVHVAYGDQSAGSARLVTNTMALGGTVGPTNVDTASYPNRGICVAAYSASQILVGWAHDFGTAGDASRFSTRLYSVAAHAATASSMRTTFGLTDPSMPWTIGGRWYCSASVYTFPYSTGSTDPIPEVSVVVVEIETAASLTGAQDATHPHVATLENQTGWRPPGRITPKSETDASGNVWIAAPYRNREPPNANTILPIGYSLHKLTVSDAALMQTATVGVACIGVTAAPFWWDGATAMPYGFAQAPIILGVTASAGGSVAVGTYGYTIVFGWRDANGVFHRSPPSPVKTGTSAGASNTLNVQISTASLSGKQRASYGTATPSPVQDIIHRSTVGGSLYFRLTYEPTYNVQLNNPQTEDVTFVDTVADSSVANSAAAVALNSLPQVYTATGELDDVQPPAAVAILGHNGRVWLIASDEHTIWATKSVADDATVAPGFNEALTLYYPEKKTCLGALGEAVAVLGETSIDLVFGDGPDATGAGAWSRVSVPTDRGCTNPRSLASIPQGLFMQTSLGIEILTPGRTLEWVGEPVRDQLATYSTITSAVVVPSQHQVRFSCVNSDASAGRVLVFDYVRRMWMVWNYGFAIVDAVLVGGVYTFLRANGTVYREDTATKLDSGTTWVTMAAELQIKPGGPNSWTRVKDVQLLGTSVTNHDLVVKVRRDFSASYEQTKTFAAAGAVTAIGVKEVARMTLARQKGQGFVVRLEDATPSGGAAVSTGAGAVFESLAVYVDSKRGLPKASGGRKA